jgi:predicted nucleotidyltransferase
MTLGALIEKTIDDSELKATIAELIERKQNGAELDRGPAIPRLSKFIRDELDRLGSKNLNDQRAKSTTDRLNKVFRSSLIEAWGSG